MSHSPDTVLDDPVGESLRGRHRHLAQRHGRALRYHPDVSTFVTVPVAPDAGDWADLAALLGPDGFADLFSHPASPPPWESVFAMGGRQLVAEPDRVAEARAGLDGALEVVELDAADVPEMLALAERTRPGPFWTRTIEMGRYVGVRVDGVLVAMAGERLRPPDWTEISAVCTAPELRGRGLAAHLVTELVAGITARGEGAFLHVVEGNDAALALYRRLGFRVRREVWFHGYLTPAG